jgi:hypothetical protein
VIVDYIDANRKEFGVEPICTVLQVAPSTYYAAKSRPPSARAGDDPVNEMDPSGMSSNLAIGIGVTVAPVGVSAFFLGATGGLAALVLPGIASDTVLNGLVGYGIAGAAVGSVIGALGSIF